MAQLSEEDRKKFREAMDKALTGKSMRDLSPEERTKIMQQASKAVPAAAKLMQAAGGVVPAPGGMPGMTVGPDPSRRRTCRTPSCPHPMPNHNSRFCSVRACSLMSRSSSRKFRMRSMCRTRPFLKKTASISCTSVAKGMGRARYQAAEAQRIGDGYRQRR